MTMFRRDFKNNLKDEIMRDDRFISDMFDLIEVIIDFDDKLYKRVMKKKYDQFQEKARIFFESTIEYYSREFRSNQKYSNSNYREFALMKLDLTQYCKEKNSRKKQNSKPKTCYSCDKLGHFARDYRSKNLIISRQINAMLKKILDSQDDIKKQINTKTNTLEIKSNDDYYLVENSNQLKKVLDKTLLDKTFASTQEVNNAIRKI